MKVRDLMVPLHGHVGPEDTLEHAATMMMQVRRDESTVGVRALVVLDRQGRLAGIVSMGDILEAVFPPYMRLMEMGDFTWDGMMEEAAKKVEDKKVRDVMTAEVVTVEAGAPLMAAIDHMIKHGVKRLPVVEVGATHKVVGMIYERDVFGAIVDLWKRNNAGGGGKA